MRAVVLADRTFARVVRKAPFFGAFVQRFATEQNRGNMNLADDAIRAIEAHAWPGNIRELENCIKRAVIMADGWQITREDIGLQTADDENAYIDLRQVRDDAERTAVATALARLAWAEACAAGCLPRE